MRVSLSKVAQGARLRADLAKSTYFADSDNMYRAVSSSNQNEKVNSGLSMV